MVSYGQIKELISRGGKGCPTVRRTARSAGHTGDLSKLPTSRREVRAPTAAPRTSVPARQTKGPPSADGLSYCIPPSFSSKPPARPGALMYLRKEAPPAGPGELSLLKSCEFFPVMLIDVYPMLIFIFYPGR